MPTLMQMLEAGVHFGHKKERSHPKAKEYTFTIREGIYVIDLEKTIEALGAAQEFLKKELDFGKTILFVATKRQAKDIIKDTAIKLGQPYINKRFLGGTLTNFETIRQNIKLMENLELQMKSPEFTTLTKKEKKTITDKHAKLLATFEGIRNMRQLPDALFIIDANREALAISEAKLKEIPVVAVTDTDANPTNIQYPIFANDDAPKSIEMIMNSIIDEIKDINVAKDVKEEKSEEKKPKSIKKIVSKTKNKIAK